MFSMCLLLDWPQHMVVLSIPKGFHFTQTLELQSDTGTNCRNFAETMNRQRHSYAMSSCLNTMHTWFDLFLILLCGGKGFLSVQQTWLCFVLVCMEAPAHLSISAGIGHAVHAQAPSLAKARRRSKRNLAQTCCTRATQACFFWWAELQVQE